MDIEELLQFKRNAKRLGATIILKAIDDYRKYCTFICKAETYDRECREYYKEIQDIRGFADTDLFDLFDLIHRDVYLAKLKRIELKRCGRLIDEIVLEKRNKSKKM